ncbi:hypothetical protein ACH9L7_20390 (plasmid) [Haloferax sp. S1W]|uniref:hypothetical protein n=1 Tax=Haloferax sp. S1W TaxID=3377110 RepID=UPI0037C8972F
MSGETPAYPVDRRPAEQLRSRSLPRSAAAREDLDGPGAWPEGTEPFGTTEWRLPGYGDRGAGCGEWYPEAVCETCGETTFSSRVCGKRSCPDCWGAWAKKAAVRATVRIQSFRYTQPPNHRRQAAHAVVSPPDGEIRTERQYWEGRKKAAEIAEQKGWRGYTVIPHPYRVTEEGKARYDQEDPDYGIWVWLRNDVEGGLTRYTYWSPHYHILGSTGADMEPAGDGDDWNYVFIRSVEKFDGVRDGESHRDLYGLLRYLLSHTGYPADSTKQVVTWYGSLANSVFVEDATESWQHQKPSEGVTSALKREVEAVAGVTEEEGSESEEARESDDMGDCPIQECGGVLIDVFDVSAYLEHNDPPPNVRKRMRAARDWRLGRLEPPAGAKNPTTEEGARESFEALLEIY